MDHLHKPKLRNISVQRTIYQNEPVFILQDGLKLTEAAIVLPQALGPVAMLCDGRHTLSDIERSLESRYGLQVTQSVLENLLEQFDQALLLEGETYDKAKLAAVETYRSAPHRQPALAGGSYPAQAGALRQMLKKYVEKAGSVASAAADSRAIISPHIDYHRGGPVYAKVWTSAAEAVRQAELVIIIGTDHNGSYGTITLTPQNYASPLGVLPTATDLVDHLADVIGPERAFSDELHHRGEHSIELDIVWLQYLREGKPCPVLPILTGSFRHFMLDEADITEDATIKAFVAALREIIASRRTLIVASGDLAHMGPAFDGSPIDTVGYEKMKIDDQALMNNLCLGSAGAFFDFMKAGQFERNVCGLSPFYFTLSALQQTKGQTISYDLCPADHNNRSFVSVCGLVWQ
ncbi:MAG: AmmeMemoRadiSam system protein B [Anaerolineae bacterium]|nr:AmmeMemoRadiSam system protein B [Anaerolineae bacterium]